MIRNRLTLGFRFPKEVVKKSKKQKNTGTEYESLDTAAPAEDPPYAQACSQEVPEAPVFSQEPLAFCS
jgi:hypothetical protein